MDVFDEFFNKNTLYFDAFDKVIESLYVCDINGNLVYFNAVAEKLDGYLLKDVKGKSTFELYGLDRKNSPMLKALTTERPVHNEEFSYYVNGKENVQICNAAPIYNDGKLVGAYTVQRDLTQFKEMVETNIALQRELLKQKNRVAADAPQDEPFADIIGQSNIFKKCKNHAWRVAKTDSSVMLVGNTGSGKEVFARAIHQHSNRANGPFLALNCAAIPETLIEGILFGTTKGVYTGAMEKEGLLAQANGGTLFLDEVNSMPITSQAKLLRVLEEKTIMKLGSGKEKEIDIRIISSTNEAPFDAVDNGHMREDLFYRLSVVQIIIPPLRERSEDIPKLVEHFIHKYNEHFQKNILGINNEVLNYFMKFLWPGNVRQLKSCVESAMNFAKDGTYISLGDLPQYMFESADTPEDKYRQWLQLKNRSAAIHPPQDIEMDTDEVAIMDSIWDEEKKEIITALRQSKGNITKAAKSLGMTRQSLSYRLKKYHLK
ncbi:MAG: sigma 54-interacting transcriptional regulator [Clostridiales bacterium]